MRAKGAPWDGTSRVRRQVLDDTNKVMDSIFLAIRNYKEYLVNYLVELRNMRVHGLARDAQFFSKAFPKRVEMLSGSSVFTTRWFLRGVGMAAGDVVYLDINNIISFW